jgi:hypothetical protein
VYGRKPKASFEQASVAAAEPAGVRDRNVKWLEPLAVAAWIDIRLRGLDREGLEDPRSRNRTGTRDAAFGGFLYGTGMRVNEGASLLAMELPRLEGSSRHYHSGRLAAAYAKGRVSRQWWTPHTALSETWDYIEGQRAEAVVRGRRFGRYDGSDGVLLVGTHGDRRVTLRSLRRNGDVSQVPLDALGPEERRRLFEPSRVLCRCHVGCSSCWRAAVAA